MLVTFPYIIEYGKNDWNECEVEVNLRKGDVDKLKASVAKGEYEELIDDESLFDIYQMVWGKIHLEDATLFMDEQRDELLDLIMEVHELEDEEAAEEILFNISIDEVMDMLEDLYPRRILMPNNIFID